MKQEHEARQKESLQHPANSQQDAVSSLPPRPNSDALPNILVALAPMAAPALISLADAILGVYLIILNILQIQASPDFRQSNRSRSDFYWSDARAHFHTLHSLFALYLLTICSYNLEYGWIARCPLCPCLLER